MFSTVGQCQESCLNGIQKRDASVLPKKERVQSEINISAQNAFRAHAVGSQTSLNEGKWETTKVTTNGHTVCITYSAQTHQVAARVLHQNRGSMEISSAYLPSELKRVRNAEQFKFLMDQCYLRTATFSNGEIVLHLNGRLAGGSGYTEAVTQFKSHLQDLANPYLYEDILKKLSEISTGVLDTERGVMSSFADLSIPEDTQKVLTNLSREIADYGRARVDDLPAAVVEIKRDLKQLVTDGKREDLLWPELGLLLNLPHIRQRSNEDIKKILRFIKLNRTEDLKTFIETLLDPEKIADCDKLLKSTKYKYMKTLLSQVIKQIPKKKEGIVAYWNQTPAFFIDKSLIVSDPAHLKSVSGTIVKAEKDAQNRWVFHLQDETEVVITSQYGVTTRQRTKCKLWTAISHQIIAPGQPFKLVLPPDRQMEKVMRPGEYTIQSVTDKSSLISGNFTEIVLAGASSGIIRYKLYAYYDTQSTQVSRIEVYQVNERIDKKLQDLNPSAFNGIYSALTTSETQIGDIKSEQADDHIQVKDERDENKIKIQHLRAINEMLDEIRSGLLAKENKALLDLLIDELFNQKLIKVDLKILRIHQSELAARVEKVSQKYAADLNTQQPPEVILKKLVEEANYARLIDKEQGVVVARTMELLRQSHEEIITILNKTIIAFFGDTGSGKSTAVNYFKGVELEYFTNRVGDRVIQITKDVADQNGLPKIGQALGESETLYTKGYPLTVRDENNNNDQGEEIVLADFPGFEDTRGEDYELCTQLSIDLAILNASRIRSVVITIPIHAFLTERANSVIQLVEKVRERFPFAFNPDKPKDNASIFVLITKASQVRQETANGIKDRIDELFRESQRRIATLMEEAQAGKEENNFDLRSIQRRSRIWQALQQMYNRSQIHLIEIDDTVDRDELLQQFRSAPGIDKKEYVQAMQSQELKMKFGKYVEMSTDTWTSHIFKQYLRELPDSIRKAEGKIGEKKRKIESHKDDKKKRTADLDKWRLAETTCAALINELENAQRDSQNSLSDDLRAKLEAMVAQSRNAAILRLQGDLVQKNQQIATAQAEIVTHNGKIAEVTQTKTAKETQKTTLEADVTRLSAGNHKIDLWSRSWEPDDVIHLNSFNPKDRQAAFDQVREMSSSEVTDAGSVRAKDRREPLYHDAFIEQKYNLVPADPAQSKQFQAAFSRGNSASVGNYQAEVSGKRFSIDLGMKATADAKKILYGFKTEWKGDIIPEIKIAHSIPNIDYNEATIIGKNAQIAVLVRKISELDFEITEKKDEKRRADARLAVLQGEKSQIERDIEAQKKTVTEEKLGEMLKSERKELEKIRSKIKELRDFTAIDSEIAQLEKEVKELEDKILQLHKDKRNLAIVIHQQKGTAKVIRDFSQIVVDQAKTSTEERAELVDACREFMISYDQNIGKVEAECKKDLPFIN